MGDDSTEGIKNTLDFVAGGTAFASLLGALPPIAAGLSILYTLVRLWETKTVQGWLGRGGD
jgi:hypothetical protein